MRDVSTHRVVSHADHVGLLGVQFVVYRSGRAFVRGDWSLDPAPMAHIIESWANVSYDGRWSQWWYGKRMDIEAAEVVMLNVERDNPTVVAYDPKIPLQAWLTT